MATPCVALLDYAGTFAFALSGGRVAVRHRLDRLGVLVLAFAAATAGGSAGLACLFWHERVERRRFAPRGR